MRRLTNLPLTRRNSNPGHPRAPALAFAWVNSSPNVIENEAESINRKRSCETHLYKSESLNNAERYQSASKDRITTKRPHKRSTKSKSWHPVQRAYSLGACNEN